MIMKSLTVFNQEYKMILDKNVFEPNLTTKLMIESCYEKIKKMKKINLVDIGCGCGIIGIVLKKKLKIKEKSYFSDISSNAVENTKKNLELYNQNGEVLKGNVLNPWKNKKFNVYISDVSAIAHDISIISPWYKSVENNSGTDGTKFTIEFLKFFKDNNINKSFIFFPVISLSNRKKILKFLNDNFQNYKCLNKKTWFLPEEFNGQEKLLENLKKNDVIDFKEYFGKKLCFTEIYCIKI